MCIITAVWCTVMGCNVHISVTSCLSGLACYTSVSTNTGMQAASMLVSGADLASHVGLQVLLCLLIRCQRCGLLLLGRR